jgi:hypothetical protein
MRRDKSEKDSLWQQDRLGKQNSKRKSERNSTFSNWLSVFNMNSVKPASNGAKGLIEYFIVQLRLDLMTDSFNGLMGQTYWQTQMSVMCQHGPAEGHIEMTAVEESRFELIRAEEIV